LLSPLLGEGGNGVLPRGDGSDQILGGNDLDWFFGSSGTDLFLDRRHDEFWN